MNTYYNLYKFEVSFLHEPTGAETFITTRAVNVQQAIFQASIMMHEQENIDMADMHEWLFTGCTFVPGEKPTIT